MPVLSSCGGATAPGGGIHGCRESTSVHSLSCAWVLVPAFAFSRALSWLECGGCGCFFFSRWPAACAEAGQWLPSLRLRFEAAVPPVFTAAAASLVSVAGALKVQRCRVPVALVAALEVQCSPATGSVSVILAVAADIVVATIVDTAFAIVAAASSAMLFNLIAATTSAASFICSCAASGFSVVVAGCTSVLVGNKYSFLARGWAHKSNVVCCQPSFWPQKLC